MTLELNGTSIGVPILSGFLTPNYPYSFDPHINIFPSKSIKELCMAPHDIERIVGGTKTLVGMYFDLNYPTPKLPYSPNPHA